MRHNGFFGQLEAGKYWVTTAIYFAGTLVSNYPPVELQIVVCD